MKQPTNKHYDVRMICQEILRQHDNRLAYIKKQMAELPPGLPSQEAARRVEIERAASVIYPMPSALHAYDLPKGLIDWLEGPGIPAIYEWLRPE